LVAFTGNGAANKGSNPMASLIPGSDGNLYGVTTSGGSAGGGTVFKVTPTGILTTVMAFPAPNFGGSHPEGGLVQGSDGAFYGRPTPVEL